MRYQRDIHRYGEEGSQQSSRFDLERYRVIASNAIAVMFPEGAPRDELDDLVARSYLRLLSEAIAMGCSVPEASGEHRELLSELLCERVPRHLNQVPRERRVACLAMLWNLGEGLLQEPGWMNRFAIALTGEVTDLWSMPEHLARVLEPVLVPRPPSQWKGPCALQVLDPRPIDASFLPGVLHLAAPSVVCVHGRQRDAVRVGIYLEHGGRSHFVGRTPCLGSSIHEGALPAVSFAPGKVTIGERATALPHLLAPLEKLVVASGFVLATAVDSQRIWVVDSP